MAGNKSKPKAGTGHGQKKASSKQQSGKQAKASAVDISHQGASYIRDILKVSSRLLEVETRFMRFCTFECIGIADVTCTCYLNTPSGSSDDDRGHIRLVNLMSAYIYIVPFSCLASGANTAPTLLVRLLSNQ
jgi:hypothetical protein